MLRGDPGGVSIGAAAKPTACRDTALDLLQRGFWPVVIRARGENYHGQGGDKTAEGKEPYMKGWGSQKITSGELNHEYQVCPDRGIGICLGPERGPDGTWLADFEGDGPQAEKSYLMLTGGVALSTMSWISARGFHHEHTVDGNRLLALLAQAGGKEGTGIKSGVWKLDCCCPIWR